MTAICEVTPDERRAWLRLSRTSSIGPVTFFALIARFGSATAALEALPDFARSVGRRNPLNIPSLDSVEAELIKLGRLGATVLTAHDPGYPESLRVVAPPPPIIAVHGNVALLNRPMVAIVGARNASAAGLKIARTIAADLGDAGWVVVSGLARGIDGAAHQAALKTGTIAVVAGGLDFVYPPEHAALQAEIAKRGAIVSENPLGAAVHAKDFPRRNRIVSGLSHGVVVIEAQEKSGSLITARTASEQGREVFAVPGSPLDPRSKGTNGLIRLGATLTESASDVLAVLSNLREPMVREDAVMPDWLDEPAPYDDDLRGRLRALLSPTPVTLDDLAEAAHARASTIAAMIVDLELNGEAISLPGGLIVRGE